MVPFFTLFTPNTLNNVYCNTAHLDAMTHHKKQIKHTSQNLSIYAIQDSESMRAEGLVREAWWNGSGLNKQHGYGEIWDSHQVC